MTNDEATIAKMRTEIHQLRASNAEIARQRDEAVRDVKEMAHRSGQFGSALAMAAVERFALLEKLERVQAVGCHPLDDPRVKNEIARNAEMFRGLEILEKQARNERDDARGQLAHHEGERARLLQRLAIKLSGRVNGVMGLEDLVADACSVIENYDDLADRIQTIADEAFGPFPVQDADTNLTAIECGINKLRQDLSASELRCGRAVAVVRVVQKFTPLYSHDPRNGSLQSPTVAAACELLEAERDYENACAKAADDGCSLANDGEPNDGLALAAANEGARIAATSRGVD